MFFFSFKVAHPLVRDQLISYIYNGFLVPVLGPALHQVSQLIPPPPHPPLLESLNYFIYAITLFIGC